MRLMLLGAGGNAGINFVKSLKKADENVFVLGLDLDFYNLISSNSDHKEVLKFENQDEKIEKINFLIDKFGIDLIHAQPDPEVKFLCSNSQHLKAKCFPHSLSEWEAMSNKLLCSQIWREKLNLDFSSYSLESVLKNPDLFSNLNSNGKVWCRAITGAGSKAALPITTLKEADNWANYWINSRNLKKSDFMLSEFLDGPEYAVQTFWKNGKLIHSQARERLVYFFGNIMPSGQSSTPAVAKTIANQEVYEVAHKSILAMSERPNGIYCVDLKTNSEGSVVPMEINYGRFFTTSDFFAEIGINTPHVYCRSVMGDEMLEEDIKINSVKQNIYWIRGLDKKPFLHISK